jgi:hypothetical protein
VGYRGRATCGKNRSRREREHRTVIQINVSYVGAAGLSVNSP